MNTDGGIAGFLPGTPPSNHAVGHPFFRTLAEMERAFETSGLLGEMNCYAVAFGASSCRIGIVASVVATAMRTNMVKSVGERTPSSSPTFSTINSIRPRVFIRMPRAAASHRFDPVREAAMKVPPNLPSDATAMIKMQTKKFRRP